MRTLYYDCFAGISGDMNLGALLELGISFEHLKNGLSQLGLDHEFEIRAEKGEKNGISGTKVHVLEKHPHHPSQGHEHDGTHHHHHNHRHYGHIKKIILDSQLSDSVKTKALAIFDEVAKAEAKVHGKTIEEVHFHEVGAIDSIVDIVGAAICFDALGIERVLTGKIEVGSGFVKCAHGLIPVPAPATAEILKGYPILSKVEKFEMTTPTGAGILVGMKAQYQPEKDFAIEKIGYGLGTWTLDIPNALRVILLAEKPLIETQSLIETNIDDMSAEQLVFVEELLFEEGALDVYKTPIVMKKGRLAVKLSVLCDENRIDALTQCVIRETTAIGVRVLKVQKRMCHRSTEKLATPLGEVTIKKAYYEGELVNEKPEYEDCKRLAKVHGMSLKKVYACIQKSLESKRETC